MTWKSGAGDFLALAEDADYQAQRSDDMKEKEMLAANRGRLQGPG